MLQQHMCILHYVIYVLYMYCINCTDMIVYFPMIKGFLAIVVVIHKIKSYLLVQCNYVTLSFFNLCNMKALKVIDAYTYVLNNLHCETYMFM